MRNTKKKNTQTFIKECIEKRGFKYDYSLVSYINNKKKVKIICKYHGVFEQTPNNHLSKLQDCPLCSEKHFDLKTTEQVISDFKLKHGDKYDYSKIEYKGNKVKVEIICKKHGSFYQTPNNHMKGQNCKECTKISTEEFIKRSINIHKNKYNYDSVNYVNMNKKVKILCKKHGFFNQVPHSHLYGIGCPDCQESKGEREIRNELDRLGINYKSQYSFENCFFKKKLKFDFYIPTLNTCIEYDGEQHFRAIDFYGGISNFKNQKQRDLIKEKYCSDYNIKLIRISYKDELKIKLSECLL